MPFLIVKSKDGTSTYPLVEGKPMYLGRAKECDVVLPSPSVSRKHAVILYKHGLCGVKDLGSFNGTLLNDRAVQTPQHLTDHDILKISSFVIRLQSRRPVEPEIPAALGPPVRDDADTTVISPAAAGQLHPDAPIFMNTDLRLPRAMRDTESRYRDTQGNADDTQYFESGIETEAFLNEAGEARQDNDGQSPDVTDYFRDKWEGTPEGAVDAPPVEAVSYDSSEAEAIIPLVDPEEIPVLTFAIDPEPEAPSLEPEEAIGTVDNAAAVVAEIAGVPSPVPVAEDCEGLDDVPLSPDLMARVDERLALYSDPEALAADADTLPRVFKECYTLAADEPLAKELIAARVNPGRLFGSGLYLLLLRQMLDAGIDDPQREDVVSREIAALERVAVAEFTKAYRETSLSFIPAHETMPTVVRAFLRYGMLGVKGWWIRPETRDFILRDCQDHSPLSVQFQADTVMVLYADEFLAAVTDMECAPSSDPDLEKLEYLTVARLADRSYRRIVNAGSYNIRLKGLIASMEERLNAVNKRLADSPDPDLSAERDVMASQIEHIKEDIMDSILESVQQAEGRFRRGELPMPSQEELLRRETSRFLTLAAELSPDDVYMPLVLRERFPLTPEIVNDRQTLRERVVRLELRRDGLFDRVLNPNDRAGDHIHLRLPPLFILCPISAGRCLRSLPSHGMDGGHILAPIVYSLMGIADTSMAALLLDGDDEQ
ncbi:MAG: FHA domain-containing protein [Planctomycetaceae bacterium]|nr:FHA domain-containing protein [Planctomycetaceae bacterium]